MPYVCASCDAFDGESAAASACSACGGRMRFTLLDPRATATATLEPPTKPAWHDPYINGYDEIEAPWSFRYAQIGIGVSTYSSVWCWGRRILMFAMGIPIVSLPQHKMQVKLIVGILIMNGLAALAGGGVSGFWCRNWIPQGLGVAVGSIAIPLMMAFVIPPDSWTLFCVNAASTSVLAVVGAYLGHRLVRPTRIVRL